MKKVYRIDLETFNGSLGCYEYEETLDILETEPEQDPGAWGILLPGDGFVGIYDDTTNDFLWGFEIIDGEAGPIIYAHETEVIYKED